MSRAAEKEMKSERHLDEELKPTVLEERKTFVDSAAPGNSAALRADRFLRCYGTTMRRTVAKRYSEDAAKPPVRLGVGVEGERKTLVKVSINWDTDRSVWVYRGPCHTAYLDRDVAEEDAAYWLGHLRTVEREIPLFSEGKPAHGTPEVRVVHYVGSRTDKEHVASAKKDTREISWFFHPDAAGRLYSVGICRVTSDIPDKRRRVKLRRMFLHELAHLLEAEPRVEEWLLALTDDLPKAAEAGRLDELAQDMNPQYLPFAVQDFQHAKDPGRNAGELAAEFLPEAYAGLVWESPPRRWKPGLWPALDALADEMKSKVLLQPATHVPVPEKVEGRRVLRGDWFTPPDL